MRNATAIFAAILIASFAYYGSVKANDNVKSQEPAKTSQNYGRNFVDKNGDGKCDNAGAGLRSGKDRGRNNGANWGCCKNGSKAGKGQGKNYIDKNGDGKCDNQGTGLRSGKGRGVNFIDKDGDGKCDNISK